MCKTFFITEFGIFDRVGGGLTAQYIGQDGTLFYVNGGNGAGAGLIGEIGFMTNTSATAAHGYTFSMSGGPSGAHYAVNARRRRWLNPGGAAFDYSVGAVTGHLATLRGDEIGLGANVGIAIGEKDLVGAFARADLLRSKHRTEPSLMVGVRGGAQVGLVSAGATAVLLGILIAVLIRTGFD